MADGITDFARKLRVPVSETLSIGADFIVLLDYSEASRARIGGNLFRVRADGEVVWTISLPDASDSITKVQWRDGKLIAWTWWGHMMVVDASDGAVLETVFTK